MPASFLLVPGALNRDRRNTDMTTWDKSFREAFCERYGCTAERFVPLAARKALPWRVRLLRPVILLLHPSHFHLDLELMERVGEARSWSECHAALGAFNSNNKMRGGFFRNSVKLRASGRRVTRLVGRVMGKPDRHGYEGARTSGPSA